MADMPSVLSFDEPLANAEAPSPLPAGEYRASVRSIEQKLSKSSGNPMLDVTYVISADQYPADFTDGDPDGTILHNYVTIANTKRDRYRLRKFCEMHGVAPSAQIHLADFIGTEVWLNVTHEEFNGEPRPRGVPVRGV